MKLWGNGEHDTEITFYKATEKITDAAVIILPGGGYSGRAQHEGEGYAEFFQAEGINSFVVDYRVSPNRFPLPLLDARRAVRWVRENAEQFGVNPGKLAVMGSSAGGHLAAMLSTYKGKIDGEDIDRTDSVDFLPNAQILCYPVIVNPSTGYAHEGSYINLLGEGNMDYMKNVDPALNADNTTPQAFIWHTADDSVVNVINSYEYAKALRNAGVDVEMHIFPHGSHGLGLAKDFPHVAQWSSLLINWFREIKWIG